LPVAVAVAVQGEAVVVLVDLEPVLGQAVEDLLLKLV